MYLIVSSIGSVNWDTTRHELVSCADFALGKRDFGAGSELYAKCPGCDRELPTALMELDHILAKATHRLRILPNISVTLAKAGSPNAPTDSFEAIIEGPVTKIYTAKPQSVSRRPDLERSAKHRPALMEIKAAIHSEIAWENDLENLQWLCLKCNSSKQARPFAEVFAGKIARPFK